MNEDKVPITVSDKAKDLKGDVFEEDILQVTEKDKDLMLNKMFAKNFRSKCFIKTKFHCQFIDRISIARLTSGQKKTLVGIQGIGKSTSVIYYVLRCRKNGDLGIHYLDLNAIEATDKNLKKFKQYVNGVTSHDCLIIDHVTLFNMALVKNIEEVTQYTQIILIETGFTACANPTTGLDFNKDLQLDLDEFDKIWKGSLLLKVSDSPLLQVGEEVYNELRKELIVTPRLLHSTLDDMMLHSLKIEAVRYSAKCRLREEIIKFSIDVNEAQFEGFINDTKTLLELMKYDDEGFTTALDTLQEFKIAINIFDVQINIVTNRALKENYRLLELELKEGDIYVTISELQTCLRCFWIENFPFKCEKIVHQENSKEVLQKFVENGGMHKDFVIAIVKFQEENNLIIIPDEYNFMDTRSFETSGKFAVDFCIGVIKPRHPLHCLKPDTEKLKEYGDENTDTYDKPLRNIHRTALFLKKEIINSRDKSFLLYPSVKNLIGFDYFLYTETNPSHSGNVDESGSSSQPKRRRIGGTLFLVHVASGIFRTGLTMHKALEVFRNTIKEVTIHVMVLIGTKRSGPFTLTGDCGFKNISVINIGEKHYLKFLKSCLQEKHNIVVDAILANSIKDTCQYGNEALYDVLSTHVHLGTSIEYLTNN